VIEKLEEVVNAYFAGRCDVYTTDTSGLVAVRASRAANAAEHVILSEVVSKEPFGPAVRHGDDRWFDIVKWSLFATIEAEEMGLSSKNIEQQANSTSPVIQRIVGASGELGKMLGLDKRWAYNITKQVGNYGECFERHLTPMGLDPGLNSCGTRAADARRHCAAFSEVQCSVQSSGQSSLWVWGLNSRWPCWIACPQALCSRLGTII
jgi:general L-amino acid transport system substrate-binding protein